MATLASRHPSSPLMHNHSRSQSHSRPPSAPPTSIDSPARTPPMMSPRAFSPTPTASPTSPQQSELLWAARWKAYEDKKAGWVQTSWAEYEKRKEGDTSGRWKEYEESKKKLAEVELQGKRPKGAFPYMTAEEARAWKAFSPSPPLAPQPLPLPRSRVSSRASSPLSPTPLRSPIYEYATTAGGRPPSSRSARSATPSTPPPTIYRTTTPSTPKSPRLTASAPAIPPRSPTRPTRVSTTMRSQTSTPSPLVSTNLNSPGLFFPATATTTSSQTHRRSRSNTNPTLAPFTSSPLLSNAVPPVPILPKSNSKPAPQIFMPRPTKPAPPPVTTPNSDEEAAASREVEAMLAEERKRRTAAEERANLKAARRIKEMEREQMDQAAQLERSKSILEHQDRLVQSAWEAYEARWKGLYDGSYPLSGVTMTFSDVPWPVVGEIRSVSELDRGRLEGFLLWDGVDGIGRQTKAVKQRVRDAMLRFHPDRFEGRWMNSIQYDDRAAVKEGAGRVMRFLNEFSTQLAA